MTEGANLERLLSQLGSSTERSSVSQSGSIIERTVSQSGSLVERSPKKDKTSIYEFIDNESLEISLGRVVGMEQIVTMTSQMLLKIIMKRNHWNGIPSVLVEEIRRCGEIIMRRNPLHFEIRNTILRILRFIRRAAQTVYLEHKQQLAQEAVQKNVGSPAPSSKLMPELSPAHCTPSPHSVSPADSGMAPNPPAGDVDMRATLSASRVLGDDMDEKPYMVQVFDKVMRAKLREIVSTNCSDFEGEIGLALDEIGLLAREHVHPNECILVYGYSSAVLRFLSCAHERGVKFEVLVADSAPRCDGQQMTVELVKAGITTTLIPDSALFVMMPRVSKVIVGANAIMSNGGVITSSGVHLLALVARRHGVPVTVCSTLIKLTPVYPYDLEFLSCLDNPAEVLPHDMLPNPDTVGVLNPRFDYVPPELVSLFITDHGCHTPSFIYRLLEEYYDAEDYNYNPM